MKNNIEALRMLISNRIEDIILPGYIDLEEPNKYSAYYRTLYIRIANKLIRIDQSEQCSKVGISIVDQLYELDHILQDEDTFRFYSSSIEHIVLDDVRVEGNTVREFRFYNMDNQEFRIECSLFVMELANGQVITIDPTDIDGLKIGSDVLINKWLEYYVEHLRGEKVNLSILNSAGVELFQAYSISTNKFS